MSTPAPLQNAAAKPLQAARANLFLQRKCACGAGASSLTGECEDCSKKKMVGLQTKLRINETDDPYEQEADRVAEQVLAKPAHSDVSSAPPPIQPLAGQFRGQRDLAPVNVDRVITDRDRSLERALGEGAELGFGHDHSRMRVGPGTRARQVNTDVHTVTWSVLQPQFDPGLIGLRAHLDPVETELASGPICSARQARDPFRIQTKVMVGPANDPFEHEADVVAETVMRMSAENPAPAATPKPRVQRACAKCQHEAEENGLIMRRAIGQQGGQAEGLSHDSLTRGGSALPRSVRDFFEPRFGRDFSAVRVHSGTDSNRFNVTLRSYAFTYGNHIWLGEGEMARPSLLMAHELAHVVQQSGPRTLRYRGQVSADREGRVRRATDFWYFEPYDTGGADTHKKVLPNLQKSNPGLLYEIPSPVSNDGITDYDKKGQADLYWPTPKTIVGVYFKQHDWPKPLPHPKRLAGVQFAPAYDDLTDTLKHMTAGPTEVRIGDLKPIGLSSHAGVEQVQGYINGLELVLSEVGDLKKTKTDGTWAAKAGYAKPLTGLTIPDMYQPYTFTGQNARELVLKSASLTGRALDSIKVKKTLPLEHVQGHLAVMEAAQFQGKGIWNHFWVPDSLPEAALPEELLRLDEVTRTQIIPSLTQVPVKPQPKSRRDAVREDPAPIVRRRGGAPKGIAVRDPFSFPEWQKDVASVTTAFHKAEKDPGTQKSIEKVEATESAVNNLHNLGAGAHLKIPKAASGLNRLKFWTGPATALLGRFRQVFGGAFVSLARLFLFGREKFRLLIKNHQKDAPDTPGGAVGAIVRIIFKVAKYALMTMLPQIVDRLWRSLTEGLKTKLLSLIPDAIAEEFEKRKTQLEEVLPFLEKLVDVDVLQWLKNLVEPIEGILSKIGKAVSVLKSVKEIVDTIKWSIRAVNCATALEGNVVGCIGSFVGFVSDFLIKKVVENCTVQQTIIPHLLKMDLIKTDAPNWIAEQIVEFARGLLPNSYRDVLADPPKSGYYADKSDVPCEEQRTKMDIVMDELSLIFGDDEAKLFALAELMNALSGDDLQVDPDKILEIGNLVNALGVTAEQMQNWARNVGQVPKDIPDAFRQPLDEMFRSISGGDKPPQEFETPETTVGEGQGSGGGGKGGGVGETTGSGAGGAGEDIPTGGKTVTAVPSSAVQFQGTPTGTVPDATVEIVSGASATHKKGEQVTGLVLHGVWARGGIDTVVNGVSATVVDVVTKGGKVISVTYDIQDQVTFDLERVAEARKKGEALGCYRLCIKKGKRRIAKF